MTSSIVVVVVEVEAAEMEAVQISIALNFPRQPSAENRSKRNRQSMPLTYISPIIYGVVCIIIASADGITRNRINRIIVNNRIIRIISPIINYI